MAYQVLHLLAEVGYPPTPKQGTPQPGLMGWGGVYTRWGDPLAGYSPAGYPLARSERGVPKSGYPQLGTPLLLDLAWVPPPPAGPELPGGHVDKRQYDRVGSEI